MAGFTQTEPQQGREILHAALRNRLHRRPAVPVPTGLAQSGMPLPAYRLTARGAAQAKPLLRVRKVGWRYPVLIGETPCLAYLKYTSHGLRFGGMSEGSLPRSLFDAAAFAEQELGAVETIFQPRFLEVPSARLYALWLFAPRGASRFIRLTNGFDTAEGPRIDTDIMQ